jgi:hypothetical protein
MKDYFNVFHTLTHSIPVAHVAGKNLDLIADG